MPGDDEVTQRAGSLQALTGLTDAEFHALLPHFEQALVTYRQDRTIDGQPRTSRRYRSYATCPLPTLADKRLFIVDVLEAESHSSSARTALWDESIECEHMDSRAASRLESGLRRPRTAASPNGRSVCRAVQDAGDGGTIHPPPFWPDGTERPIHRPADPEEHQEYDSGKKTCHTLKNLLVINETCHVCFLSHT